MLLQSTLWHLESQSLKTCKCCYCWHGQSVVSLGRGTLRVPLRDLTHTELPQAPLGAEAATVTESNGSWLLCLSSCL